MANREEMKTKLQHYGRADLLDATMAAMDIITEEPEEETNNEESLPADYCTIGQTKCYRCGTTYDYPVAVCDNCNCSFVD